MRENPFPGMNPFMEDPLFWSNVHSQFITLMNLELNRILPIEYSTRVEERIYVENWEKPYVADSAVVLTRSLPPENDGGAAVLVREQTDFVDAPLIVEWDTLPVRELYLEIRSRNENHDLVTVIELLSPTNKEPGQGRDEYRNKQSELARSWVHFLEIDLLRAGHFGAGSNETLLRRERKNADYFVSLHRGGQANKYECWPAQIRDKLPCVTVPLAREEDFVALDLQKVVNRVYSEGGIWRYVGYQDAPNPPLRLNDEKWADALLREKGLRS